MNLEEELLKKFREASEADEIVLSDRTIKDTISLYGLPEEDKADEFVDKLTPLFKTVAGQSRYILSKAKEDREKELERIKQEKDNGLGVPQSGKKEQSTNDKMDEVLESLKKTIENQGQTLESMSQELQQFKTKEAKANLFTELEGYAKAKGLSDKYVLDKSFEYITLEDKDVDTLKKELESTYAAEFKKCRNTEPTYSGSNNGSSDADDEWDSFFKKKEAEESYFKQKKD